MKPASFIINFGAGEIWDGINSHFEKQWPLGPSRLILTKPKFDVTDPDKVLRGYRYASEIEDKEGVWVVYTAGVSHIQRIEDMDPAKVREEFESNVLGAFNVAHVGMSRGYKNFIFLVSVAGLYGKPNHAGYSASKMALRSLIESMAMEGANTYGISPGRVDTQMRERDYPGEPKWSRLSTEQIARVVEEVMGGKYQPGDNVIIRKRGKRVLRRVDRNRQWKEYLNIQPL